MNSARVAAAILLITSLSFWVFPGHSYLQQDSQIYVPILENQWSGALAHDLIVERPHVNFTLYDELTNSARWLTRASLEHVLEGEQFFFRALGFLGIYLLAHAFGLGPGSSLLVTAIWALGAAIKGPEVLTVEYEPTPRSFAVPLLFLAAGLTLHRRFWLAGVAGGAAILFHAPAAWPFLLALIPVVVRKPRAALALVPISVSLIALVVIGFAQPVSEPQSFFSHIPPDLESLQRMRASYNYVSTWWKQWTAQYVLLAAIACFALRRIRAGAAASDLCYVLIAVGLGSIPLSYLLLEVGRLSIVPQIQPTRALLFLVGIAVLVIAAAATRAAKSGQFLEAAGWFVVALWIPAGGSTLGAVTLRPALLVVTVSLTLATLPRWHWAMAFLLAPAMAFIGYIFILRDVQTSELAMMADWARTTTAQESVFLFPEAGHDRAPGWFRSVALRPVYVDWKGGGQVNYLPAFAHEWWRRWTATMTSKHSETPASYQNLPVRYIALRRAYGFGTAPVYARGGWFVYSARGN